MIFKKKEKVTKVENLYNYKSNIFEDLFDILKDAVINLLIIARYACFKVLSILTIPFSIIGLVGGYYLFKGITLYADTNVSFSDNEYLRKMLIFLVPYMLYIFLKEILRYHGEEYYKK